MKDWIHFALALPVFLAGLLWAWLCDHFSRGIAYWEWLNRE